MNREAAGADGAPGAGAGITSITGITTLFTDIEGSTRLWEQQPDRMRTALAAHDAIVRQTIEQHRGRIVKTTGDGVHAVFDDAVDAVAAMVELARRVDDPAATDGLPLKLRQGAHCGAEEWRGGDYYGRDVNRAARVMSVAHGGQLLVSQAVVDRIGDRWPAEVRARDLGRVRLRDLAEPQQVWQLLHPALRPEFPALRSLEATPNNLPQQLNRFIGRQREMAEVAELLREARLVTLLGLGGLGKSRLAVQLAAELLDEHPDGVWLVELAGVVDPDLVPYAMAEVLGVQEEAGRSIVLSLQHTLKDRRSLIVLDNCEHVLAACADLVKRLLQATGALSVLATSREALQVAGERVHGLLPLSAPEPDDWTQTMLPGAPSAAGPGAAVDVDRLLTHDSVRLFVDRAVAAQDRFVLDPSNAADVALVCHQLDGIPLALELAAARVRSLSVRTIAERLADRFRLLKTPDQTVLPRQRTLQALIDWSYDLLDEGDRCLLARLSVFAGGCTLDAVEAVAALDRADDPVSPGDVIDRLSSLVEKSLVARDLSGDRYRLLETVRVYAQARLEAGGGGSLSRGKVEARHVQHYLALAERSFQALLGPAKREWLDRLDADRENLLAAQVRAIDGGDDPEPALRLTYSLRIYWAARGRLGLALELGRRAIHRAGADRPTVERCGGLFAVGQMAYFVGEHLEARRQLELALALAESLQRDDWILRCAQPLGAACLALGDRTVALAHLERALGLAKKLEDRHQTVSTTSMLAMAHRMEGSFDRAHELYGEALTQARESGDPDAIAISLLNVAMVRTLAGSPLDAVSMLLEVLAIAQQTSSKALLQYVIDAAAGLAGERGDWASAATFYGAAEALSAASGLQRDPADAAFVLPRIALARTALGDSAFELAEAIGRADPEQRAAITLREWLGRAGTSPSTDS